MIEGDEISVGVLKRLFPSVNFNNFKTLNTILQSCDALDNEENQKEFSAYLLACAVKDLHKLNAANLRQQAELRDKIDTLEDELDTLTDKKKIKATEKRIEKLQEELKALKKKIYATPFDEYETAYDNKVCDGTIAKYKDKYGQAQKDIINYQRTLLDMMVDSGILSEEQKIGYMKTYPNHIPMFRKFDENEDKNFGDSLKAMTGSTRDIIDPLASLTKNTYDFVRRAEKNKAKCLLANLARTGALGTVVEVDERTLLTKWTTKSPMSIRR